MPKTDMTAFAARTGELIAANAIHAICLILAFVPVPFILYYITELHLWDTDLQFIFQTIAFTAGICILIYAGLRAVIWLLYAIVPVIVWLLYIAVHGLAWLLRTVIVPGTLWLLSVAMPAVASRFMQPSAAWCSGFATGTSRSLSIGLAFKKSLSGHKLCYRQGGIWFRE